MHELLNSFDYVLMYSDISISYTDEISGSASFESLSSDAKYYLLTKQAETSNSLQRYVNNTDMLVSIAIGEQ